MLPVCDPLAEFALAEKLTVPLPLPVQPPVIVSQDVLLVADQPQPEEAEMFTLPEPPPAPMLSLLEDRL